MDTDRSNGQNMHLPLIVHQTICILTLSIKQLVFQHKLALHWQLDAIQEVYRLHRMENLFLQRNSTQINFCLFSKSDNRRSYGNGKFCTYFKCPESVFVHPTGKYVFVLYGRRSDWINWWIYNRIQIQEQLHLINTATNGVIFSNRITIDPSGENFYIVQAIAQII